MRDGHSRSLRYLKVLARVDAIDSRWAEVRGKDWGRAAGWLAAGVCVVERKKFRGISNSCQREGSSAVKNVK
jgi:hypothetical protein